MRALQRLWNRLFRRAKPAETIPADDFQKAVLRDAMRYAQFALTCGKPDYVLVEKPCAECRAKAERQARWRTELAAELAALGERKVQEEEWQA